VDRIAIVGPVASGKTTLATSLGSISGLPVIELDDYYWRQSTLPTDEQWAARHAELISGDRWIISGDYRAVAGARFQAADIVVWVDLSWPRCLVRATARKLKGNPTPLLNSWSWIWRYANHGRHDTAAALASADLTCKIHRLRSTSDVNSFLGQFQN
jgi:adenylate kinase family enzyme